jgi:hypothetical protein
MPDLYRHRLVVDEMADVENPSPDDDGVHLSGKAEAVKGTESLGLCAGALVTWTVLAAVGLVVFFSPSFHARAPKAVRVLASIGLSVAIVGFAAGIAWCARVLRPGCDNAVSMGNQ